MFAKLLGLVAALSASTVSAQAASLSVWQGQYTCGQGVTGLTLTMGDESAGKVQALFHFYGVPQNPTVPDGCFEMSGSLNGAGHLELLPGNWREHPAGYVSVAFTGDIGADGHLNGRITGPGCTFASLGRVTDVVAAGLKGCAAAIS